MTRRRALLYGAVAIAVVAIVLLVLPVFSTLQPAYYRRYPGLGERICQPLRTMRKVLSLIRHHHERFDGSGYPDGLRGEEITLGARILSVADAYDALTSARSYRRSFTSEDAISLLESESRAGRWDPKVFSSLAALVRRVG